MFFDEHGSIIRHMHVEREEQEQASAYITEDCVVLELGARYGTVSCTINKMLSNLNNLVVVEPDSRVWTALETNMKLNSCDFHIVKGFISNVSLDLVQPDNDPYGTTAVKLTNESSLGDSQQPKIPSYTLEYIQTKYNVKFNTLVADCEGFLEQFLDENPELYDQIQLIMFEKDYPIKCNYDRIMYNLQKHGFQQIVAGFHEVWRKS
jgi:FkbM family methyltransferase